MIAIVIYGIIAIALAAVAGYSIISFFDAASTMSRASENISRIDMAVSIVEANVMYIDGEAMVPMADNLDSTYKYSVLPSWLSVHDVSTTGDKYVYCPFASKDSGGPTASALVVQDQDGNTLYTVETVDQDGRTYVSENNTAATTLLQTANADNMGVLAFLLSPIEGSASVPGCNEVTYNSTDGVFSVPNGIVRVIQEGTMFSQRNLQSSSKSIFYVADTATGDGTGRGPDNAATLDTAMAYMGAHAPRVMEVIMDAGSYSLDSVTFDNQINSLGEAKLYLMADRGKLLDYTDITITTSDNNFEVPVNLHLLNVNLDANVKVLPGKTLFVDGTTQVRSVELYGGELVLNGADTFASGEATELKVNSGITGNNGYSAGIVIHPGGKLTSVVGSGDYNKITFLSNSITTSMEVMGEVNLENTQLVFNNVINVGVVLESGAVFRMDGSGSGISPTGSGSTTPTVGIEDYGAVSISGEGAQVRGAGFACWTIDNIFSLTESVQNGSSSAPVYDDAMALTMTNINNIARSNGNKSDWTCY